MVITEHFLVFLQLLSLYVTSGTIDLDGQRVLELGSGVGLGGLAAARMTSRPDRVILTDNQEEVLDVLDQNVVLNYPHSEDKGWLLFSDLVIQALWHKCRDCCSKLR